MKFTLHNAQQGHQVLTEIWTKAKPHLMAGRKFTLIIESEKKTSPQERLYHSIIGEIAKQASHLGSTWDEDDFKRILVDQFTRDIGMPPARITRSLDGTGIVQLGHQTRDFDKQVASQFVDWLYAWCAQNGVEIS